MERSSQAGRGASSLFSSPLWDTPVCTMSTPVAAAMRERGSGSLVRETYRPANSLRGGRYRCGPHMRGEPDVPFVSAALQFTAALVLAHKGHQSAKDSWHGWEDYHDRQPLRGLPKNDHSGESVPFPSTRRAVPVAKPAVSTGATRGTRFAVDGMGVVVGPLLKRRSRWLLIGVTSIHLPRRMTCELAIGTLVRVAYTEREGRRLVETIQPLPESPPMLRRRP
jgi:hypothetical protein